MSYGSSVCSACDPARSARERRRPARPQVRLRFATTAASVVGISAAAFSVAVSSAGARPVQIGTYTEIPYGISALHPWATHAGGPRRHGRSQLAVPQEQPRRRWAVRAGVGRAFAPAISAEGLLYVGSASGVLSLTPQGEERWKRRLGLVSGTPSITPEGNVAVGAQGGEVVIIAPNGRVRSRAVVGGGIRESPLVLADGSVVVSALDQALHRLDAEGRRLFRAALPAQARGAPAWNERGLIAATAGTRVLFVSPRGATRARVTLGTEIVAGPAIADDGTVWVLTEEGSLHALTEDGHVGQRIDVGGTVSLSSGIAVGPEGAVRVGTRDAGLVCFAPDGTERWRVRKEGGFPGGISVGREGVTLAVNQEGRLYAVAPDGTIRWHVHTGSRTEEAPVLGPQQTIYVATIGGMVQAWR